jgi:hypothetical protein
VRRPEIPQVLREELRDPFSLTGGDLSGEHLEHRARHTLRIGYREPAEAGGAGGEEFPPVLFLRLP